MNRKAITELFQEYADAYARGDQPRAREYIARADASDREPLTELLDRFVAATPVREASPEEVVQLDAWVGGESLLLALRTRHRLKRIEVVDALMTALRLKPEKREKVRLRYHQLETGQLEPARVDERVWEALATTLRTRSEELRAWVPPRRTLEHDAAFFRIAASSTPAVLRAQQGDLDDRDEVDRLFGVGPSEL